VVTKISVWVGMFSWRELFSEMVCGCVPGLPRTGSPVVPQLVFLKQLSYSGYKIDCENLFGNKPLHE
jgi:hypothetical protein